MQPSLHFFWSDLITDHFNRAVDPPLWPQPKHVGQNPAIAGCISLSAVRPNSEQPLLQVFFWGGVFCLLRRCLVVFSGETADARPDLSASGSAESPLGYRVDARTHGNGTKMRVLREIRQVSVDALPAATRAHVAITVQNVDVSSDKTDKPNESPSCFGLGGGEKCQVQ